MLSPSDFTIRKVFVSLGKHLFSSWDFYSAVVIGAGGTFVYTWFVPATSTHISVAGDFLVIAGPMLGVVIASLAIVAALVETRFVAAMGRSNVAPYDILRHFLIEGVLLVAALVGAIIYRALAHAVAVATHAAEYALFGLAVFLFFWSLFGVLQLMRLVLSIAVTSLSIVRDSTSEQPKAS